MDMRSEKNGKSANGNRGDLPARTSQSIEWYAQGEERTVEVKGVAVVVRFVGRKGPPRANCNYGATWRGIPRIRPETGRVRLSVETWQHGSVVTTDFPQSLGWSERNHTPPNVKYATQDGYAIRGQVDNGDGRK